MGIIMSVQSAEGQSLSTRVYDLSFLFLVLGLVVACLGPSPHLAMPKVFVRRVVATRAESFSSAT
jgi:hypothetical protein